MLDISILPLGCIALHDYYNYYSIIIDLPRFLQLMENSLIRNGHPHVEQLLYTEELGRLHFEQLKRIALRGSIHQHVPQITYREYSVVSTNRYSNKSMFIGDMSVVDSPSTQQ